MTITHIRRDTDSLVSEILASRGMNKVYIYLSVHGPSTSEQIAQGAHLYPSTVRGLLSKMTKEGYIVRKKLEKKTVGKNPYIYKAVSLRKLAAIHMKRIYAKLRKVRESENNSIKETSTRD